MKTHTPTLRFVVPLAILLLVAACGGSGASSPAGTAPSTLAGTAWTVQTVDGKAAVAGKEPTVAFADTTIAGSGGCNTYGGDYTYDAAKATVTVGALVSTMKACDGPEGTFEAAFYAAFTGPMTVALAGDVLTLTGGGHTIVLDKAAAPAAAPTTLAGTSWIVQSVDDSPAVVGKEPSVAFDDTNVSGSGGCNTYSGGYTYDAATATLTPGPLASTRKACTGPEGTFENVFFQAFQGPLVVATTADGVTFTGGGHTIALTTAP